MTIRLIHCRELKFEEFHDPPEEYAILSHTWRRDKRGNETEVTYQDFQARPKRRRRGRKRGWRKVETACDIALEHNLEWIWIDSCCINKNDIQEVTEAINSMYQWYEQSRICIAYLRDLDGTELTSCTWFLRGWTLQELIAPSKVLFYNKYWEYCGSKNGYDIENKYDEAKDLSSRVADISGIDRDLLRTNDSVLIKRSLSSIPACQKMYWASKRKTTKAEDMAYCLIGIFGINHMHLKYGEGRGAFIRLQEEIIKQSSDSTLFAWQVINPVQCITENLLNLDEKGPYESLFEFPESHRSFHGIFACHPGEFQLASKIKPKQHIIYNDEITVTSRGIKLTTPLWGAGPCEPFTMPLHCYDHNQKPCKPLGIALRWVGDNVYARTSIQDLPYFEPAKVLPSQDEIFVTRKVDDLWDCIGLLHRNSIRIPKMLGGQLERINVSPGFLWSERYELFMTIGKMFPVGYATYNVPQDENSVVRLIFGLDYEEQPWFHLVEPGSPMEPLVLEMRRVYLDRIWREAIQEQSKSLDFMINAVSGQQSQPYQVHVEGPRVVEKKTLHNQTIFHLDLKAVMYNTSQGNSSTDKSASAFSTQGDPVQTQISHNLASNPPSPVLNIGNVRHQTMAPNAMSPASQLSVTLPTTAYTSQKLSSAHSDGQNGSTDTYTEPVPSMSPNTDFRWGVSKTRVKQQVSVQTQNSPLSAGAPLSSSASSAGKKLLSFKEERLVGASYSQKIRKVKKH